MFIYFVGIISYFCLPCMVCNLSSRTGDCACMPLCVPGGNIAIRSRVRTLGGIQVCDKYLRLLFNDYYQCSINQKPSIKQGQTMQ